MGNIEDLLPVPWHLIEVEKYIHRDTYIKSRLRVLDLGQTRRGCPFNCGFWSNASIRGDDEFYIDRKRAYHICQGMVKEKVDVGLYTSGTRVDVFMKATDDELAMLRRAGAHTLKFGAKMEQTLAANRRCLKHGFVPAFALVVGYPTETFADINLTIDLSYRLKKENPQDRRREKAAYLALGGRILFPVLAGISTGLGGHLVRPEADWLKAGLHALVPYGLRVGLVRRPGRLLFDPRV